MVSLCPGRYRLDGLPGCGNGRSRTCHRPRPARCPPTSETGNGCPPVDRGSRGTRRGRRAPDPHQGRSEQPVPERLAPGGPLCRKRSDDRGGQARFVSVPYVEMTLAMMRQFNLQVTNDHCNRFHVPAAQGGAARPLTIEPDTSAASYFFAAAAITGGSIRVTGLPTPSLQGDVRFVAVGTSAGAGLVHNDGSSASTSMLSRTFCTSVWARQ